MSRILSGKVDEMAEMVGPEVPEAIQRIRNERLGRVSNEAQDQSSDDDFAGPSLDDYKNEGGNAKEELIARRKLEKSQNVENLDGETKVNDSKHDSWMSMKPEWAENAPNSKHKEENQADLQPSQSTKPSLLEQHNERRRLEGLSDKEAVQYDSNESLNLEIRKEIFRKASSLNDRFTKSS